MKMQVTFDARNELEEQLLAAQEGLLSMVQQLKNN
jgi:hypothetical protein